MDRVQSPGFAEEDTEVQRRQKCLAPTSGKADGRGTWNPGRPSSAHTPALFSGPCGSRAPVPGEAVRATLPGPQLRAARGRSTCRRRAPRPPEARGSRLSTRPPASQAARTAVRSAYSTLHFAEGADAQRVAQHVVSDLHPPVVLLLLSHLRRARPRSAACRSAPPPLPPPTHSAAGPAGGGGGPRAARGTGRRGVPGGGAGRAGPRWEATGERRAGRGRGRERAAPAPGSERRLRQSKRQRRRGPGTRGAGRECPRGRARCTGSE